MCLSHWQPDIVGILLAKKKIAIGPEVTLPFDSWQVAFQGAYSRKTQSYSPLIIAIQDYINSEWTVEILPWGPVAGGLEPRAGSGWICSHLRSISLKSQNGTGIIEFTFSTSVEQLVNINRICFSVSSQNNNFDTDDPKSSCTSHENLLSEGNKRKIQKVSEESEDLSVLQKNGSKSMVIEDSCTVFTITEINCHPLPLRDANNECLCTWGNPCAHVRPILFNHVCMSVLPRRLSWCAREAEAIAPLYPQSRIPAFFWNFIKVSSVWVLWRTIT